jgi:hypothetical protein
LRSLQRVEAFADRPIRSVACALHSTIFVADRAEPDASGSVSHTPTCANADAVTPPVRLAVRRYGRTHHGPSRAARGTAA